MQPTEFVKKLYTDAELYEQSVGPNLHDETFSLHVQWASNPSQHVKDLCKIIEMAGDLITDLYSELQILEQSVSDLKQDKVELQDTLQDMKYKISCRYGQNNLGKNLGF